MERMKHYRVGYGTDLHRLEPNGRPLVLGGVLVEHPKGFGPVAHSDGDVLLHAVIDALLGAACMGDIGTHFPDSDPRWKDADSSELLELALAMTNLHICNVDIVINCDRPKIGPYRNEIASNVSRLLGMVSGGVNIKAKSFEGLPLQGGVEAIYVQAVLLAQLA
ncbi:MAG: 2-C-methyl-D-erythritol 2,4-cyclodiphosphate synthase [Planctomycetota bacterium]